ACQCQTPGNWTSARIERHAGVVELADTEALKAFVPQGTCRFESCPRQDYFVRRGGSMTRRSLIVAVSLLVTCVQPVGAVMLLKEGIRIGGEMSGYGGKDSMTAGTKQSTYGPAIGAFLNLGLGPLAVEPE